LGVDPFFGELSGDGIEFWASLTALTHQLEGMECGWYGSGRSKTTHIASFLFLDSCFSAAL